MATFEIMHEDNYETVFDKLEAVLTVFCESEKSVIDDTSLQKLFSLFETILDSKSSFDSQIKM